MTKLLIFSDSHGATSSMCYAIERQRPNYVIHLGDYVRDAHWLETRFPELPVISLPGNCDGVFSGPHLTKLLDFDGVKIFMTHGHPYDVKRGLFRIELAGREAGADVVLFGHTHQRYCEQFDGLWLMNPGACGEWRPSCGLVEIRDGKAACSLLDLDL